MGGGAVFNGLADFAMIGYAFFVCIALTVVIEYVTEHRTSDCASKPKRRSPTKMLALSCSRSAVSLRS